MKAWILTLLISVLSVGVGDVFAQSMSENRGTGSYRGYGRPPDRGPKVGDMAPTFRLMSLDGKTETDLGTYKGKNPVVLFFGSYS